MRKGLILLFVLLGFLGFGQKIVIDAGHGWGAPLSGGGCANPDTRLSIEMEASHSVSHKLANLLTTCAGVQTLLTRPNNGCNSWVSLAQRTTMSNSWGGDALISIHTNAFNGSATGTETFWCSISPSSNTADASFCNIVQNNMVSYGSWFDRRAVEDNSYIFHLAVLRNSNASSILSEIGFGDNPSDYIKLADDGRRDQFALAYLESLKSYLGFVCNQTPTTEGSCVDPIEITCGTSYNGSTFTGMSEHNTYGCSSIPEYGREKIHEFTLSQMSNITASITNLTVDLDLYLLTDPCDSSTCIARDDFVIGLDSLPAGTYYLVVDGYGNSGSAAAGTYKLNLNCYPVSKGSGSCDNPIQITCGERFKGTTTNGSTAIDVYTCASNLPQEGREKIHVFTMNDTSDITLQISDLGYDLDIHLSEDCNTNNCLERDDNTITYDGLPSGTYYVIVDGYGTNLTQEGNYTLTLSCAKSSGAAPTCNDPIPVSCGSTYVGTTTDGQANFNSYGCGPQDEFGKEKVHRITIDSAAAFTAVVQNLSVDLDIHLLTDSCDPNSCIARDDNTIGIDTLQPGTYYIVIDGFGTSQTAQAGTYELYIECVAIPNVHPCTDPVPLTCGVPYNGTTLDGQDLMNNYNCTNVNQFGKEKVHVFTLPDSANIAVEIYGMTSNLDVLVLTDSCDPNSCLSHGYFALSLDSLPPGRYYAVVDGQGTDATAQADDYTIELTCDYFVTDTIQDSISDIDTTQDTIQDTIVDSSSFIFEDIRYNQWIEVYPNPTVDKIQINSHKNNSREVVYTLFNISGSLLEEGEFRITTEVSLYNYAKGTYILRLTDGVNYSTQRIIKR